jgi:hypothetical protein
MRFFGYVTGCNIRICCSGTIIYIADFFTKALPKAKISCITILSLMLNFRKENKLKE